jgi:hypothetical protein
MVDQWLLAVILFLLCLNVTYFCGKTVLSSDTRSTPVLQSTSETLRYFLRLEIPKYTLAYLISHYALLSALSPKMEQELGNNGAQSWQWMLMYAH